MRRALEGAAVMAAARVAQSMNAQSAVSTMRALATLRVAGCQWGARCFRRRRLCTRL